MADLNYHHLRYFWAVARDGNLTRTAERLNLSQSALSVQIKALEARLGHDLFERRGRSLVLTEAGRIALDHANTIFAAGDELVGTLRQTGSVRRALRVGALSTLSRNFQLDFLRPVLGRADVEIVLRSGSAGELFDALQALALDVVLTNTAPPQDSLTPFVSRRLADQPISLFGRPERMRAASLREILTREPVILPTQSAIRAGFDALVDRLDIRPQIAAEVDDMAMIRLLARADAGIAMVPPVVLRDELDQGVLVEAPHDLGIRESFLAVTTPRRFPNPLLNSLLSADADAGADAERPAGRPGHEA